MSIANRIRAELMYGPLRPCDLARRAEMPYGDVGPYLHQLQRAKKDPVIRLEDGRYALKRAYTKEKSGVTGVPCREREFRELKRNFFSHRDLAMLTRGEKQ